MTSPFGAASRRDSDDLPRFRHPMDPPQRVRKRLALLAAFGAVLLSGGGLALIGAPQALLAPAETPVPAAPMAAAPENIGPEVAEIVREAADVADVQTAAKAARPVKTELPPEDPRWAVELAGEAGLAQGEPELAALSGGSRPDPDVTAAVVPRTSLKAAPAPKPAEKPPAKIAPKPAAPVRYTIGEAWTGFATEHVKLRAGPDNATAVLSVVPSSAAVTVHGCKAWCNISYRGQRGFVFKTFLRTAEAAAAKTTSAKPAAAKPAEAKPKKENAAQKPVLSIWDSPS